MCRGTAKTFLIFNRKERVKETVVSYVSRSEVDKILIEATANENWNIANTKLQTLADAAYQKYLFFSHT
jgi:hypothetical protein